MLIEILLVAAIIGFLWLVSFLSTTLGLSAFAITKILVICSFFFAAGIFFLMTAIYVITYYSPQPPSHPITRWERFGTAGFMSFLAIISITIGLYAFPPLSLVSVSLSIVCTILAMAILLIAADNFLPDTSTEA